MTACENIIGITRNKTNCAGIKYTVSKSGLYLDDTTEGRLPISPKLFTSNDETVKDYLTRVIEDSYEEVLDMLYVEGSTNYVQNVPSLSFNCPRKKDWNSSLKAANYYYMALQPYYRRGAYVTIKNVTIPTATTFKIIDEYGEEYYNGAITDFVPIDIQLDKIYFIVYQSGERPRNYKYKCCGAEPEYLKFFTPGGGAVDSEEDIVFKTSDYSQGILLECYGSCNPFYNLCDIDFKNDGWGRVFARLLLMTARKNMAEWLLNSDAVTPYILTNREDIEKLALYYTEQIAHRKEFLPSRNHNSDCYTCGQIQKSMIKT